MVDIPKSWFEITFNQYIELFEIEQSTDIEFNKTFEQLAVLLDISSDDPYFDELSVDEAFKIFDKIRWLKSPIPKKIEKDFNEYKLIDFNDLTFGEFIDIENFLAADPIQNKILLCSILYKKWKFDEWNNIIFEPYIYDINERAKLFQDCSIVFVESLFDSWLNFKSNFMKNYEQLFEKDVDEKFDEEVSGADAKEQKKLMIEDKKRRKWSWENLIWNLSSNDITKFEQIFSQKLILVFNILSMRKSLGVD